MVVVLSYLLKALLFIIVGGVVAIGGYAMVGAGGQEEVSCFGMKARATVEAEARPCLARRPPGRRRAGAERTAHRASYLIISRHKKMRRARRITTNLKK
jgi:hypothetical protein